MTRVYAFEYCPLRQMAHAVADRSRPVRWFAAALWPTARRAERVEVSDEGIEAWTLAGRTRLQWSDVTDVRAGRTLRIRGAAGTIRIATILPGYDELAARVLAARAC